MRVIDLSHIIHPEIPVYPGTERPQIVQANTIVEHGFAEVRISMFSHTATHIDAPRHILQDGHSLDRLQVGNYIGQAFLINVTKMDTPEIGIEQLENYATNLEKADFALLHTGWSEHWGRESYFRGFPHLSEAAAEWLTRFPLRGVGIDTISIDPIERADLPAHHQLLGKGMIIIENLTNLKAVPASEFIFSCLPLPIRDADGSPVRAVAIIEEGGRP